MLDDSPMNSQIAQAELLVVKSASAQLGMQSFVQLSAETAIVLLAASLLSSDKANLGIGNASKSSESLALGLLSFSKVDLEVLIKAGQPQDRKNAAKILPIVKNEHLLLCTLLIVKSLAMEALPIFLDSILPAWAAILMSVTLVITFAEIIPQAVCSRHGLSLGANLSPLVRFLLQLFYPVAYPISKMLDWLLGKAHSALLRRAELKTYVDLHANEAGKGGELSHHETTIISGALDLTQKSAQDAMTPISEIFSLDINSKLDMYDLSALIFMCGVPIFALSFKSWFIFILRHTMGLIMNRGHSRVPIYSGSPNNLIGIILVRNQRICRFLLILTKICIFELDHLNLITHENSSPYDRIANIIISTNTSPLYSTDTEFQSPTIKSVVEQDKELHPQGKNWERGVGDTSYEDLESLPSNLDEEIIGIVTMEDVMEELLQGEILDETDEYVAVHNKQMPKASAPAANHLLQEDRTTHNNIKQNSNSDEDEEIPNEVFNRIIKRILVSVGAPMALGLAFLMFFGAAKEQGIWDVPLWIPFTTTFLTFGTSALGIAYGALSTSLDPNKRVRYSGLKRPSRIGLRCGKKKMRASSEEGNQ
ncbi:hypothetical protein GH714_028604 [Hevea brasiliensis]|uniref:CNNM transmembrane domain-containing protein n=1 Tax=Hevea brasiliensis TaxID=3981 RepID=A0A6A6MG15_HEVBR|nr:hypothetical protein GH714_028604 [Hevea brasiliensis]